MTKLILRICSSSATFFFALAMTGTVEFLMPVHEAEIIATGCELFEASTSAKKTGEIRMTQSDSGCTKHGLKPVWHLILKELDNWSETQKATLNCMHHEVAFFDLDSNGTEEIIVRAGDLPFCNAEGNCSLWVFKKNGDDYRLILNTQDGMGRIGDKILANRTLGFKDLRVVIRAGCCIREYTYYRYNGFEYIKTGSEIFENFKENGQWIKRSENT